MFKLERSIVGAILLLLLAGCQTTNNSRQDPQMDLGKLVIAEPLAVSLQSEIRLARFSELLYHPELTPRQRAQTFFERGVLFDSFGLVNLARIDFNRALRINPKMPDVYNFLGIHLTMAGQFTKAYEAFDATLELAPKHQYVYLNRGIALYYGGLTKLAIDDLVTFHQLDVSDPYRVIWRYIAEQRLDKTTALKNLKRHQKEIDNESWAKQIGELFLMNLSQAQFVAGLTKNIKTPKQLAERLCEAYFYLGVYASIYQQPERAINYFKLSLATNVFEFVEHRYARRELLENRFVIHQKKLQQQALKKPAAKTQ